MIVLIDTRLWILALKSPYYSESDPVAELSGRTRDFVFKCIQENTICLSAQLLAEIYHVLTDRGRRIPKLMAAGLVNDILEYPGTIYKNPETPLVREALSLSAKSGIHLWDFLIVLPFREELERIYTTDPHFKNCKELQVAEVENPLEIWESE